MIDGGLRKLFRANLIGNIDWLSVETGGTAMGVPDSNFCVNPGIEGWIEFKRATANAVSVRKEQVAWIERRVRLGGRVFIAVRRWKDAGTRTDARDDLILIRGAGVRALFLDGISGAEKGRFVAGSWSGGPSKWGWDQVRHLLIR